MSLLPSISASSTTAREVRRVTSTFQFPGSILLRDEIPLSLAFSLKTCFKFFFLISFNSFRPLWVRVRERVGIGISLFFLNLTWTINARLPVIQSYSHFVVYLTVVFSLFQTTMLPFVCLLFLVCFGLLCRRLFVCLQFIFYI